MRKLTYRRDNGTIGWQGEVDNVLKKLYTYESADEQGRLITLPCKHGDTIYAVNHISDQIIKCEVVAICIANEIVYEIEFEAQEICLEYCDGCPFESWAAYGEEAEWDCDSGYGRYRFTNEDFGIKIFASRAEAENALKSLRNHGKN